MNFSLKIAIIFASLLAALGVGYDMYSLFQAEQEWGYLPLFFFLALWTFIIFSTEKWFSKMPNKWQLLAASTATGVLLSLGFPPIPFTMLMFVAFVPLLWVEHSIASQNEGTAKWEVFKYAFHAFMVWNLLTTYWVANTAFVPSLFAFFFNSLFMAIPFVGFHQSKKVLPQKFTYVAFVCYWLTFEYVHLNWEISWPWLTLGNSFAEYHSLAQWYEYTGVFGGSLWILVGNVLFFLYWKNREQLRFYDKSILAFVAWIFIPIAISLGIYYNYEEKGQTVEAVIVQPNYNPHFEKFTASLEEQLSRYTKLAASQLSDSTDYLVFPETSFYVVDVDLPMAHGAMEAMKNFVQRYPRLNLVTGIVGKKRYAPNEPLTGDAIRTYIGDGDTLHYEIYNASVQISAKSDALPIYKKSKLVPGPEMIPYHKVFFFLKPLADKLGGTLEGHGTQASRSVFASPQGNRIGTMICYESIYGDYSTGYIKKGANLLAIITNDGWWDDTGGYRQHKTFASLRAIETRRGIARSANTGSSCFVNQRGDILQATDYGVEAAIKGKIYLNNAITFYVRWGDLIARIALFLSILLAVNTFTKGFMDKRKGQVVS